MDEGQIITQIKGNTDLVWLGNRRREMLLMEDHLHALAEGQKHEALAWENSSPSIFPEEFEAEMDGLKSDLAPINRLLDQVEKIRFAIEGRIKELGVKD